MTASITWPITPPVICPLLTWLALSDQCVFLPTFSDFFLFFDTLSFISKALTMMLSLPVSLFAPSLLSSYLSFKSKIECLFIRQIWWWDCVPRHVFIYLFLLPLSRFALHCSVLDWSHQEAGTLPVLVIMVCFLCLAQSSCSINN